MYLINDLQDYLFSIDSCVDFVALEDKILSNKISQLNLVCIINITVK